MQRSQLGVAALAITIGLTLAACGDDGVALDPQLGGDTTREVAGSTAFSFAAPTLTNEQRREFEIGDSFFTQNWVTAPSSTDARDGLGPTFNAQACSSCHTLDGRGIPASTGDGSLGLLLRLSVPAAEGAPVDVPGYGGQLQDRSILGVPSEGTLVISYAEEVGEFADGTPYSLRVPTYTIEAPAFGALPDDLMVSPRLAPQMIGVGLLEAIPEAAIVAAADPDDENGDGVSGRPNYVVDPRTGDTALGRLGWKANVATVEAQVAGAFHGDIGITSDIHPEQDCPEPQVACADAPDGGQPELTEARLGSVTFYSRTLAVPSMRDSDDAEVQRGAEVFETIGCSTCHTPTQHTGDSPIAALADQTIHPYTDLLLHDMGDALSDERPDGEATGNEWRTPPLWGLGLIAEVNKQRFLLHDGRARTLEEAILWHGGEGEASREAFRTAGADMREALLAFLEAL